MGDHASIFINAAFVMGCMALAIVFIALPLPSNEGLKKYRISLRFLAGAYLTMAILKILVMAFNMATVNFISNERLTISSLQATLFAIALITLLNPRFVVKNYLFKQIAPVIILNMLYVLAASIWGNPIIRNFNELIEYSLHPAMLIREAFMLFYLGQLVYLTRLFFLQTRLFESEIDNYFTDSIHLYLPWVRYCYFAALSIGISAFLSCFFVSELWVLLFTITFTIFYFIFGIFYIQYPRTFVYIEPAILPHGGNSEKTGKSNNRLDWNELKNQILSEKYYLKAGVNIEDMARYLKIGRTTLSLFINNEEGMNFNSWINTFRIEEAKDLLLKYPDYNLIKISEMVGYSESSNFSRQFKMITNESPSIWRQTHLS